MCVVDWELGSKAPRCWVSISCTGLTNLGEYTLGIVQPMCLQREMTEDNPKLYFPR